LKVSEEDKKDLENARARAVQVENEIKQRKKEQRLQLIEACNKVEEKRVL